MREEDCGRDIQAQIWDFEILYHILGNILPQFRRLNAGRVVEYDFRFSHLRKRFLNGGGKGGGGGHVRDVGVDAGGGRGRCDEGGAVGEVRGGAG